jgi:outer membrane cobalamin receptor
MNAKKILLTLLFTAFYLSAFSQSAKTTLTGIVLTEDKLAAESVSVFLKNTPYTTVTNEKGEYTLTAEPGTYTLVVSFIGYQNKERQITLKSGANNTASISIKEDTTTLNEVSVTGKSSLERVREQVYNITAIDARKLYNTSADLNQVLNRTTGVRVRESGGMGSEFQFTLNGFSGNQVKFFLDGIPIDSYGSSFTLNNIPINLAERIDIYKGVVPVELASDALGGAVNIVTNKNIERYVDASYSFSSFNTHKASVNARFTTKKGFMTTVNAFTNYSDNSYKVDVKSYDPVSSVYGPTKKHKHFHDGYKQGSIMIESGVKNKKYADYLLAGMMVTANKKEIQQGNTMQRVVGDAFLDSKAFIPTLKYKKTDLLTKGLTASVSASYSITNSRSVDTSSANYNWAGERFTRNFDIARGELSTYKTIYVTDDYSLQTNTNLKYELNENQYLAFGHSFIDLIRKEDQEYESIYTVDMQYGKPKMSKNIAGLSYNHSAFNQKLAFTHFGKMYDFKTDMTTEDTGKIAQSFNDWGYGTAMGYFILPHLQVKASYEHAFRLPTPLEMLGNGLNYKSNIELKPESSNNINAGLAFKKTFNKHTFSLQGNYIFRDAKDFILPGPPVPTATTYENFKSIRITGIDGSIQYNYDGWLTFDINATHQKTINTDKYGSNKNEAINYYFGKQAPNVPIFYANADLGFVFKNIKYAKDFLAINIGSNFNDAYYLKYPELGEPSSKKEIPSQLVFNASVAYSLKDGRYNIALETANFTDTKVYDFYNIQKPGRSFGIKLRYFFI